MSTRREFLKQTAAAASVVVATSMQVAQADGDIRTDARVPIKANRAVHKAGARIRSVIRREETTLRLGGHGDNYHMSWAANDRQFVAVCDGVGWFEQPKGVYNSRLWSIGGGPRDALFQNVSGYPDLMAVPNSEDQHRYYGFGTLALDDRIYQFLSSPNHPFARPDGGIWSDARFVGAKLIYSPDGGRTWCNHDGSTPVIWEQRQHRSRENMVFFEEPQDAFSLLSILQMGRNYEANRDGYVYVYSPNGNTDGTMNELVMFRAPKAHLLNREAYEYASGVNSNGTATWTKDITARAVVHTFPRGWVNRTYHPWSWMPSVTYNRPLGLYMMASWGTGSAPDGLWFTKPSYLGLWVASNPWGPWTQIHEETAWTPDNDSGARAFAPQISPKWIAEDGKSFWLVWSDYQDRGDKGEIQRMLEEFKRVTDQDEWMRLMLQFRRYTPYYAFNTQRVDLVVA